MLRERHTFFYAVSFALEAAIAAISIFLAYFFRHLLYILVLQPFDLVEGPLSFTWWLFAVVVPLLPIFLYLNKAHAFLKLEDFKKIVWKIFKAVFELTFFLIMILFIFKVRYVSRVVVFAFGGFSFLLLVVKELEIKHLFYAVGKKRGGIKNILLVGAGPEAARVIKKIADFRRWGLRILGVLSLHPEENLGSELAGADILGSVRDLNTVLLNQPVDEVVLAVPLRDLAATEAIIRTCEEMGIKSRLVLDGFGARIAEPSLENLGDVGLLTFSTTSMDYWALLMKDTVDKILSFFLIILFAPIMAVICLTIRLVYGPPVIFSQKRMGLYGRIFNMRKFRTMVKEAPLRHKDLVASSDLAGPVFKMKNDPRVTKFGKFLRKYSLDELPQLFSVLKGEMSLVGPRPLPVYEGEKIENWQRRRLSMKPGITCLWQVRGRSNVSFEDWMKYDLEYIDNWNLKLDFVTLLKTVWVVLKAEGAQ